MSRASRGFCVCMIAFIFLPFSFAQTNSSSSSGKLSVHWEELTASDFRDGIHRSQGTCLLPLGILEKHGPHLPLGTDLLNVRYVAEHAAQQEYAVIFPEYYFGQIAEARHEPGTSTHFRCGVGCRGESPRRRSNPVVRYQSG